MFMNTGVVGLEYVVIYTTIFGQVLFFFSFCHSAQLTDYCNKLNNKMVGAEQRVVHVCGDIIC